MKKFILTILLGIASMQAFSKVTQVLFIGNSYTGVNNLPQLFYDLSLSLGDSVFVDTYNPGGYTLQMHSTDVNTLAKINSRPWDFVILQEQSQRPSFPPAQVAMDVYPYARQLDSLILLNNPCTETVFYMTWGRKYGDQGNCAFWPPVCTFLGMQEELRNSYVQMAIDNAALVAPVGRAWQSSWTQDSSINLWSSDNSHPSIEGSYLAACVFYETILRNSCVNAPFISSVTNSNAVFLQQVAHQIVTDSLPTWKIGAYDVVSDFTFVNNGLQILFSEQSQHATNFSWDFGDGSTSSLSQPIHNYLQPGFYTVNLISMDNCNADTAQQNIAVVASGISDLNAMGNCIQINNLAEIEVRCGRWDALSIFDAAGRQIRSTDFRKDSLQRIKDQLESGIYVLIFSSSEGNRQVIKWRNY
ncbi:MAG: PKD domain-containing protein [Bacteroidetes bacterium]|nr:PKD domain-containing protein [Bacteroidota bacterium]